MGNSVRCEHGTDGMGPGAGPAASAFGGYGRPGSAKMRATCVFTIASLRGNRVVGSAFAGHRPSTSVVVETRAGDGQAPCPHGAHSVTAATPHSRDQTRSPTDSRAVPPRAASVYRRWTSTRAMRDVPAYHPPRRLRWRLLPPHRKGRLAHHTPGPRQNWSEMMRGQARPPQLIIAVPTTHDRKRVCLFACPS